ncbi:MAG TPA: NADH-quinone oxidoreductase subunit C [Methanosarcinales archaeon]|nr:NADH-quinone oxidoreductase subunit C [Methanosarcinales archaeon]
MDGETNSPELILGSLKSQFPDVVSDALIDPRPPYMVCANVDKERIVDVCSYLKDDRQFNRLSGITSVDFLEESKFEVVYMIASYDHSVIVKLKAEVPRDESPSIDTVTTVWWNANWYEREVYEMMGIYFNGHPELTPLVLTDDMIGEYPLRKDYPEYPQTTAKYPYSDDQESVVESEYPLEEKPWPAERYYPE